MAQQINLADFLAALNDQNHRKNIKLNAKVKLLANGRYTLKIEDIEVDKSLIDELGIETKAKVKNPKTKTKGEQVKQPSKIDKLTELVTQGFANVGKRFGGLEKDVNNISDRLGNLEKDMVEVKHDVSTINTRLDRLEKLPTIAKELKNLDRVKDPAR